MPLEAEYHTAPHLKLSHVVLNIEVFMGEPAVLGGKKSVYKVLILLYKQTKWRFHLTVFVAHPGNTLLPCMHDPLTSNAVCCSAFVILLGRVAASSLQSNPWRL